MNPEDHLKQTHAPEPGPFLRQTVLNQAERAWRESPGRGVVARFAFSPLTAAACVAVAFLSALLISEIDQRVTASLIPKPHQPNVSKEWVQPSPDRPRLIWDDEMFGEVAWNGIGMGFYRAPPEESARRERDS